MRMGGSDLTGIRWSWGWRWRVSWMVKWWKGMKEDGTKKKAIILFLEATLEIGFLVEEVIHTNRNNRNIGAHEFWSHPFDRSVQGRWRMRTRGTDPHCQHRVHYHCRPFPSRSLSKSRAAVDHSMIWGQLWLDYVEVGCVNNKGEVDLPHLIIPSILPCLLPLQSSPLLLFLGPKKFPAHSIPRCTTLNWSWKQICPETIFF